MSIAMEPAIKDLGKSIVVTERPCSEETSINRGPSDQSEVQIVQLSRGSDDASGPGRCNRVSSATSRAKAAWVSFTGDTNHKLGWIATIFLMIAETISLGILSLPAAVSVLGMIAGGILIIGAGCFTTLNGYLIWLFAMKHECTDYPTAVGKIWGPLGRWIAEMLMLVFFLFLMAGHILLFLDMWRTEGGNNGCSIRITAIAAVIMAIITFSRAFKAIANFSIISCFSIVCATFAIIIALAAENNDEHRVLNTTSLNHGFTRRAQLFLAISNIVVSYTGHCCYFTIIGEMKEPKKFPRALWITNAATISMYVIAGMVIYAFVGQDVESPALLSVSKQGQQIAFGLAVPTIVAAGIILALVATRRVNDTIVHFCPSLLNGAQRSPGWMWNVLVIVMWSTAFIIANGIPFFAALLGLLGAVCGVPICMLWPVSFWLFDLRKTYGGPRFHKILLDLICSVQFVASIALVGLGLWGSAAEIQDLVVRGTGQWSPYSCAKAPS